MSRIRMLALIIVLLVLAGCSTPAGQTPDTPVPARATETAEPTPVEETVSGGNLLLNPDFDEPYVVQSFVEGQTASPWQVVWCDACPAPERNTGKNPADLRMGRPEWRQGDEDICEEATCQEWFSTYRTAFAGVYQIVNVPEDSTCTFGAKVYGITSTDADLTDSEFPNTDARRTLSVVLAANPTADIALWEFEENARGEYPLLPGWESESFDAQDGIYEEFTDVEMTFDTESPRATLAILGKVTFPVRHPAFYVDNAWLTCE